MPSLSIQRTIATGWLTISLVVVALGLQATLAPTSADAQGLLQRLRSRRAARFAPQPPATPTPPRTTPTRPRTGLATSPSLAPAPLTRDATTNRFSPPSPTKRGATPSRRPGVNADRSMGQSILNDGADLPANRRDPDAATRSSQTPSPATLGIDVVQQRGVVRVAGFQDGSNAAAAGVKNGDAIVAIEGYRVATIQDAANVIARNRPGQTVSVTVNREGVNRVARVELIEATRRGDEPSSDSGSRIARRQPMPDGANRSAATGSQNTARDANNRAGVDADLPADWGLTVQDIAGVRGVRIAKVDQASPAAAAGLKADDRLVSINGRLIGDRAALARTLSGLDATRPGQWRLVRNGQIIDRTLSSTMVDEAAVAEKDAAAKKPESSVVSDLGSVLGGFFGGGKKAKPSAATPDAGPTPPAASTSEDLPQPKAEVLSDDLSLGDDEPLTLPPPQSR